MTELNLPFIRYVKQVSNGIARTKYSYLAMQDDLLEELKKSTWKLATCATNTISTVTNKVTQSDAQYDEDGNIVKPSSFTSFIDDRYDAFKQGGDANTSNATFCGYAGMVAYRFNLPTNQTSNISEIALKFQAARYLRSGLKVVVVLNNIATPSNDWDVIRGEASSTSGQKIVASPSVESQAEGVKSWGFLSQDVPTLVDSRASEGTFTFDATTYPDIGTSTRFTYMWVYVSIEDYTDHWTYYDASTPRYYSIEGSATLVASKCSVKFAGTETSTTVTHTMDIVKNGVVPSILPEDGGAQVYHVTVQRNGDPIADGNLERIVEEITKQGGTVNRVDVLPPLGNKNASSVGGLIHFACICGKGFKGTFPNVDGLLFYDCEGQRLVNPSSVNLPMTTASRNALDDSLYHYGIVRCLMNYEQGGGFYFIPFVGNHVTENRIGEDVYYYPMLQEQVDGVYPSSERNEFYYFKYDKVNNVLKEVQARAHMSLSLKAVSGSGRVIAYPAMAVDKTWMDSVNKEVIWVGVRSGDGQADTHITIRSILHEGTPSADQYFHANNYNIRVDRLNSYTGVIKDIITVPFELAAPNTYSWPKYRACIGIQSTDGEVQFSNALSYDNTYVHDYTSSINSNSNLKILVLYRPDGTSGEAFSMYALNSSIEQSGITLNATSQVTHTSWSVLNGTITTPTANEFIVTKLDTQPLKVESTFQTRVLDYPETVNWMNEFANKYFLWAQKNEATFTVNKGSTVVNEDYPLADSAEGLRVCYGKFFNGQSIPVGGLTQRIGAACSLVGSTTAQSPDSTTPQTLNCWQLVQSSLVIPFGCPRTWKAKKVRLDWSNWTGTATTGSKIYVWLARDQFMETHPSFLGKVAASTGGNVAGCELIGEIDPTSSTRTATFNIQDLASYTATIIITAFLDMDELNPAANFTTPKGIGHIALNMMTMEVTGTDKCFLPNIQLLG